MHFQTSDFSTVKADAQKPVRVQAAVSKFFFLFFVNLRNLVVHPSKANVGPRATIPRIIFKQTRAMEANLQVVAFVKLFCLFSPRINDLFCW